jgi:hypothetical protein
MLMWFSDASGSTPAALTPPPQLAAAIAVLLTILLFLSPIRLSGQSIKLAAAAAAAAAHYQRPEQGVWCG